jgi:hypothetical protein
VRVTSWQDGESRLKKQTDFPNVCAICSTISLMKIRTTPPGIYFDITFDVEFKKCHQIPFDRPEASLFKATSPAAG